MFKSNNSTALWFTLLQVGHRKREDSSQGEHVTSVDALP